MVSGLARVIPLPDTSEPAAWLYLSDVVTLIVSAGILPGAPPKRRRAGATAAITTFSRFLPLPMVIDCPALHPSTLATRITFFPAFADVPIVVPPGVPTAAITAVSLLVPLPIIIC